MKVLILTVKEDSAGGKYGKIIKHYIENKMKGSMVEIIDFSKYISPILDKLIMKGFMRNLRNLKIYDNSSVSQNDQKALEHFNEMLFGLLWIKLKEIIDESASDIIVVTHPFYLKMIDIINERWKITVPMVAVLYDSKVRDSWIHSHVSAYVVSQEGFKNDLIELGIPGSMIYLYGMPGAESTLTPDSVIDIVNLISSISKNHDIFQDRSN